MGGGEGVLIRAKAGPRLQWLLGMKPSRLELKTLPSCLHKCCLQDVLFCDKTVNKIFSTAVVRQFVSDPELESLLREPQRE